MTKSQLLAALAASLLVVGLGVSSVPAQQQPTGSARGPLRAAPTVAMLDLKYVMENLTRFKALQSDMKVDVDRAEEQFRSERQAINNLAERLRNFKPGTPDYKGLEAEIVDRRTRFNVEQQMQKRDFLQQEAKIYHAIYLDALAPD